MLLLPEQKRNYLHAMILSHIWRVIARQLIEFLFRNGVILEGSRWTCNMSAIAVINSKSMFQ